VNGGLPPIAIEKGVSYFLPHRASSALLIKLLSNDLSFLYTCQQYLPMLIVNLQRKVLDR
jgi:hypothetical protein